MMLQPGGPPDTSAYYRIAYVWVIVVYAMYSAILWWRARRVRTQLRTLREREAGASRVT
jgi:hypothetical protein